MITAESVKNLRERTGCGMMDCKRLLWKPMAMLTRQLNCFAKKGLQPPLKSR